MVLVGAGLWPAASHASITIGSDLSLAPSQTADNCILSTPPCTQLLVDGHAGNSFPAASPTSGTVTSFGIRSAAADTITFRLGRVKPGGSLRGKGEGTGPAETLPAPGKYSFPAHLQVHVGDVVGVDTSSVSAYADNCPGGGLSTTYHPTLVDGGPFQNVDANGTCELLVNAKVKPDNIFKIKRPKRDKNRGTAKLPVLLPGPGKATVSGRRLKRTSKSASKAGKLNLPVKPKGKLKRRLIRHGSARVKAKVRFKPDGGSAHSESKRVKLIRR
jgi:hypothetical protein